MTVETIVSTVKKKSKKLIIITILGGAVFSPVIKAHTDYQDNRYRY